MAHHGDAQDDLRTEAMSGKMAAIGNDEVKTCENNFPDVLSFDRKNQKATVHM